MAEAKKLGSGDGFNDKLTVTGKCISRDGKVGGDFYGTGHVIVGIAKINIRKNDRREDAEELFLNTHFPIAFEVAREKTL